MSTNTTAPPEEGTYLSNTQVGLAYDCARAWSMAYQQGLRPRASYKKDPMRGRNMRVGTLGHLRLQHAFTSHHDGIPWDRRLAASLVSDDVPYFAEEDRDATLAADRVVADLKARRRVVLSDADGPLVEREVVVGWRELQAWLGRSVPSEVFFTFPRGIGGRLDLVDAAAVGDDPDHTIRDYKFTQKQPAVDDGICPTPDRQACWYVAVIGAKGLRVDSFVQTVVDARPMLTVGDFTREGSPHVRADGLPSRVPRNVDPETYRRAWEELRRRRRQPQHHTGPSATPAEWIEMESHVADITTIRRVLEHPMRVSQAVAREVVLDALHVVAGRLRDHAAGIAPANHRTFQQSPCRTWCDARVPCHASLGTGRGHAGFAAVAADMAAQGELETRADRKARRAAALKILAGDTP